MGNTLDNVNSESCKSYVGFGWGGGISWGTMWGTRTPSTTIDFVCNIYHAKYERNNKQNWKKEQLLLKQKLVILRSHRWRVLQTTEAWSRWHNNQSAVDICAAPRENTWVPARKQLFSIQLNFSNSVTNWISLWQNVIILRSKSCSIS